MGHRTSADYVLEHAARQVQRCKRPSFVYKDERNQVEALRRARQDVKARLAIPDMLGHNTLDPGRVVLLHRWNQGRPEGAKVYAEARLIGGATGVVIRFDMAEVGPLEHPIVHSNGTVEMAYIPN